MPDDGHSFSRVARTPTDTAYVTTVLTKIVEGLDFLETAPDNQSLNAWRKQCAWALGLLGVVKDQKLVVVSPAMMKEIDGLIRIWESGELTSFENTVVEAKNIGGEKKYRLYFDHYEDNCFAEDVEIHHSLMEKEKYNRICDRLSNFFGRCWYIIMKTGVIKLADQIQTPIKIEESYTEKSLRDGIASRKGDI